ncbi:ESPR-type extended signal peptide-containing protein, partial [Burkholderia vietnamiensis]|uniref:ESPR-type extended signal peptide-containing protein n=1 Tax=Burkholderia vietnamiensis TaxID=60552 RepID=UPI000B251342
MNKNRYRLVFSRRLGMLVPVAETETAVMGQSAGDAILDGGVSGHGCASGMPRTRLKATILGVFSLLLIGSFDQAWAGSIVNCNGASAYGSFTGGTGAGDWKSVSAPQCNALGVLLSENGNATGTLSASDAYLIVGQTTDNAAGTITLNGPNGIFLNGGSAGISVKNSKITDVADGTISATSTDAINGSQFYSLSTTISTVTNTIRYDDSAQTSVTLGGTGHAAVKLTNVADGTSATDAVNFGQLSTTNSTVASLSTGFGSLSTGLSTTASNVASLSSTVSTNVSVMGSLSSGLSTTNSNVTSLSSGLSTNVSAVGSLS